MYCPPNGTIAATVWGSGMYTDDSAICVAAALALASFEAARGGTVYIAMEAGLEGYDTEIRRGVTTTKWRLEWELSDSVRRFRKAFARTTASEARC